MLWLGKTAGELSDDRWASTLGKLEIKRRETICIETADYLPTLCGFSLLRLQFLERNEIIFPAYAWSGFLTKVTLQGLQPQRLIMQDGCHEPNLSSCRKKPWEIEKK